MRKRIIYIILGSLLVLALVGGLWFWFFGRGTTAPDNLGTLGSSGTKGGTTGNGDGTGGNGQAPVGSTAGTGVNGGTDGGVNTQTPIGTNNGPITGNDIPFVDIINSNNSGSSADTDVSGDIVWNDTFQGSSGFVFNPTDINQVNSGNVYGNPYLTPAIGADGKPIDLASSLLVVVGGCLLNYAATALIVEPPIIAADTAIGSAGGILSFFTLGLAGAQLTVNPQVHGAQASQIILDCLTRTLGKMAVQAVTNSTVNWINSGFNGKPAYVQDYNKFFAGVADQAAGQYLQGSGFAFLCSPFQLQVRLAIAQSYARRNSALSCTLTKAAANAQNFFSNTGTGNGWGNLIAFTTGGGNNPFAAYMVLQGQFSAAQQTALSTANKEIANGMGFISIKDKNGQITTPGRAIVGSFDASIQSSLDQMQVGDSINQILGSLQNALITKVLYGGLNNVNKQDNSSTANSPAQQKANALMDTLRLAVSSAQDYAGSEQRIISDIQSEQQDISTLLNCWDAASSSPTLSSAQKATAQAGEAAAIAKINQLQTMVVLHNQNIQKANNSIAKTQELETNLLLATTANNVTQIQTQWNKIVSSDVPHVYKAADLTASQQDRTTIQSTLSNINVDTSTQLQQCYALGQ